MPSTPKPTKPKKGIAAALVASMVAIATPVYVTWEGEELTAYRDVVGVLTICSGDTRNVTPGMKVSEAECKRRTAAILEEYGKAAAKASPGIENSPYEWAAHTSFTANIGKAAYARSSVSRLFNQGKRVEACRFMRRYKYAGGQVFRGLVFRREGEGNRIGEYELCLAGAVPAQLGRL